ncbi:MAG: 2-(1,2-epoxy-1,2-dihydrophenyl)acetyl-CoA isomerase [Gammaproteobacteria bacterium]|nr:MAG: 2-(1,2-epoxy-1,2-dihydrophenyl)acetyl-CoA isomerase [Gammaproteobacteria bacterium]
MRNREFDTIRFDVDNGVARLVLNRPDKLNAFTETMHAELRDAMQEVQTSDVIRCLVISGEGRAFSAGQDLADLDLSNLADVVGRNYNPLMRTITTLQIPVIAAVNGVAAGAGANLALGCDICIAARSARFIQSFEQLGLVPDNGGTWHLPKLIGLARATAICLTGEPVDAETAERWGMIYRVVDDDALGETVGKLAHRLASGATLGHAFTKQLLRQSLTNTLDQQLDLECDFQQAASQTADFREGVEAFLNKRKPDFKGR